MHNLSHRDPKKSIYHNQCLAVIVDAERLPSAAASST